jgi:putative hydrolase
MKKQITNLEIASQLERIAALLEAQDANPHRVRAYRNGANRARGLDQSLADMVMSGDGEALQALPDIGEGLARVITRIVHTGHSDILDRLEGEVSPEQVFKQVPGIGPELARRITNQLDLTTLPELEQAAHDGRLREVDGFGSRRVEQVQASLAGMLSLSAGRRARQRTRDEEEDQGQPRVATLLAVDEEYRRKAAQDELHKIAPRRFNPEHKDWLPILHTSRKGWDFTVLYSNTARAHKLQKTHDWVVIYYERDNHEDQATAVTAAQGSLQGKRIIRGREAECERYYQGENSAAG